LLKTIRSGAIDIVVIDSVAFDPKSEIEGEMGDSKMGLHAVSGIKKINRND
jgi:recombination protein RecA